MTVDLQTTSAMTLMYAKSLRNLLFSNGDWPIS